LTQLVDVDIGNAVGNVEPVENLLEVDMGDPIVLARMLTGDSDSLEWYVVLDCDVTVCWGINSISFEKLQLQENTGCRKIS
jgi:hypothetical protein